MGKANAGRRPEALYRENGTLMDVIKVENQFEVMAEQFLLRVYGVYGWHFMCVKEMKESGVSVRVHAGRRRERQRVASYAGASVSLVEAGVLGTDSFGVHVCGLA